VTHRRDGQAESPPTQIRLSPASVNSTVVALPPRSGVDSPSAKTVSNAAVNVSPFWASGPEQFRMPDLIRTALTARGDARQVVAGPAAGYWGIHIDERTLDPGDGATLFDIRFEDWILETAAKA
jgi:hypothetical protein